MSGPGVGRRRSAALLAGALAPVMLLVGLLLPTSVQQTEAGWTDAVSVEGSLAASTIPAPTLTKKCEFRTVLVASEVQIFWALPSGYALTDARLEASTSGLGSPLAPIPNYDFRANTTRLGDGTYQTNVPTGLLRGLLGLGTELEIAIFVQDSSGWVSESASVASNAGLLGLGGTCRNLT